MREVVRLAERIVRSNVAELSRPYKLTFAVTYRCQLRCGMCGIWKRGPLPEMTAEEIGRFFSTARAFSWINLSGGELFLRPDIEEIFRSIGRSCRDVYLLNFPTNGQETDRIARSVEGLVRSGRFPKLMVTVSLDGPPDLHDRIRNMPGAWERAVETFRRLREMRGRRFEVYLGMTLQDSNLEAFRDTVAAADARIGSVSADDLHVNVMHTSHYYGNSACVGIRDKARLLEALAGVRQARKTSWRSPVAYLERRYQAAAERFLRTGHGGVACQALGASLFLDPAGTVYPCTMYDSPLGNLRDVDYDLDRLWTGEHRRSLRQDIRAGKCPGCWTPCEAYQSILAGFLPFARGTR